MSDFLAPNPQGDVLGEQLRTRPHHVGPSQAFVETIESTRSPALAEVPA